MPRRLTKKDILEGANKRAALYIKEYNAEVVIRPLTDGELAEIFDVIGELPLDEDGRPDFSKLGITKNLEILWRAASKGLVEPKLSIEELKKMRFGVPEYIGTKVLELSGVVRSEEEARKKGL